MPILAAIDTQIIVLIVAAAIGVINWLSKKAEGKKPPTEPPPRDPRPQTTGDADAERMRKFLEALGLPAEQAPPPVKRPAPVAPPPLPQQRKRPKREPRPVSPPRSLDEAPAPSTRVEELHIPELETRGVAEFHTVSSQISAIPTELSAGAALDPYAAAQQQTPAESLRRLLRSRNEVRAAILLREVLGPPRGLQS
ncbi:MAG TPA: hypothetical protein VFD27_22660 [Chthoniobacteraceae bacterium]|jgi:hypothetical protein|nr:hypothetical protein [Chthoniobacteraceae bacterium]